MPDHEKCPICGGFWFEGLCYKCGAYMDKGKVVVPKPETPDRPDPVPPASPAPPEPPQKSPKVDKYKDGWDPDG